MEMSGKVQNILQKLRIIFWKLRIISQKSRNYVWNDTLRCNWNELIPNDLKLSIRADADQNWYQTLVDAEFSNYYKNTLGLSTD